MGNIWTVKEALTGDKAILNGKLLRIRCDRKNDGRLVFTDAVTGKDLWITTSLESTLYIPNGRLFSTASGSKYEMLYVVNLIPTAERCDQPKVPAVPKVESPINYDLLKGLEVIDSEEDHRPIYYGDGYDLTKFIFNKVIDEETFIEYLKSKDYRLHKSEGWWDDRHQIIPDRDYGNIWTYKWIRIYTD